MDDGGSCGSGHEEPRAPAPGPELAESTRESPRRRGAFFGLRPDEQARRDRGRDAGIAVVRDGARLGDVGAAIAEVARAAGYSVVVDFGGYGIGRKMHADPHVPHTGTRGAGMCLRAGMALTIEPMINEGTDVRMKDDGWTVVTADGRLSAWFERWW